MKTNNSSRKGILVLLIFEFIFPSCTAYRYQDISFNQAVTKNKKIKATKSDGSQYIITNIVKIDSIYYGDVESRSSAEIERLIISEKNFSRIETREYDKKSSHEASLVLVITLCVFFAAMIAAVNSSSILD